MTCSGGLSTYIEIFSLNFFFKYIKKILCNFLGRTLKYYNIFLNDLIIFFAIENFKKCPRK